MNAINLAIIDDAFDAELCRAAAAAWPAADWSGWHANYQQGYQRKLACNRWEDMPQPCKDLLREIFFLDVHRLGLGELVADTALWGGGMHDLGRDGVLGLHLDASHHAQSNLSRKLNAILFLTPHWQPEWGGALELWDADRTRPTVTIAPVFNRLVFFATTNTSWHGIPQPLACPADVRRKTLACWWYGRPQTECPREKAYFAAAVPFKGE